MRKLLKHELHPARSMAGRLYSANKGFIQGGQSALHSIRPAATGQLNTGQLAEKGGLLLTEVQGLQVRG